MTTTQKVPLQGAFLAFHHAVTTEAAPLHAALRRAVRTINLWLADGQRDERRAQQSAMRSAYRHRQAARRRRNRR